MAFPTIEGRDSTNTDGVDALSGIVVAPGIPFPNGDKVKSREVHATTTPVQGGGFNPQPPAGPDLSTLEYEPK